MDKKLFSERLSKLRTAKNISARDMSISMGQSENYINMIENQRAYPSMAVFFYICEYLGITPHEFFNYNNETPYIDDELFNEIKKLDAKSQQYILDLIKNINNRPK